MIRLFIFLPFVNARLLKSDDPELLPKAVVSQELAAEALQTPSDYCDVNGVTGYSGFIPVLPDNSSMYYWLINKLGTDITTDSSPLIMWLDGGPGVSSFNGNLHEIGPFYINSSLDPVARTPTWVSNYHMIFVDNPLGTGFSFVTNEADYSVNEDQVSENLYTLLLGLNEKHPEWFSNRDFYIFGPSYAGKYVPSIASYILQMNQKSGQPKFPLIGIGIGDGLTDPVTQLVSYSEYAFAAGLIDEYEREVVEQIEQDVLQAIQAENWPIVFPTAMEALGYITQQCGNMSVYDVRTNELYLPPYGYEWPALNATKELLHVPLNLKFTGESLPAYEGLLPDMGKSVKNLMPFLLENLKKVILYQGQDDMIVSPIGAANWVDSVEWSGQADYLAAPRTPWIVNGEVAGYVQKSGVLTQLFYLDAGHGVEFFQPERGFAMINTFIQDGDWS